MMTAASADGRLIAVQAGILSCLRLLAGVDRANLSALREIATKSLGPGA
jgi:hypothetical protein